MEVKLSAQTITILGRQITYEIKDIDIDTLNFYTENPRINYIISKTSPDQVTQELIENELLKLDATKELIKAFEENKDILDEVYVLRNKVIEGNRRLCAFRRLNKKHPEDKRWKFIKTRVLQDDVTEGELFTILGIFHIKGKKQWDAYEKAAFIYKNIKVLKKNPDEIAKQLKMQKGTIEVMLKAYEVMSTKYLVQTNDISPMSDGRDELTKYSYFEAFFSKKDLVKRSEETPIFVDEFIGWVKDGRLKNARNVRDLPAILNNKKAREEFLETEPKEAFDEAMRILYSNKPEKVDSFYKNIKKFRDLIDNAEVAEVKKEIENKNKAHQLKKCYKELKKFCKEIGLDIN